MRSRRAPGAWIAAAAILFALASSAPAAAKDPRPAIVALVLAGDSSGALNELHSALRADPTGARRLGLLFLRGHLLERLGKSREAADAFAASVASEPSLAPWARLRLARAQDRLGHPEVAAGLAAALLAGPAPAPLIEPAAGLLVSTLERGGDCRLLQGLPLRRLPNHERRLLELAAAECRSRAADAAGAADRYRALLEESTDDDVALHATEGLAATAAASDGENTDLLLGLVFYRHREFDRALPHLERALSGGGGDSEELRHAIGRSHFWQARYGAAANAFAELAQRTVDPLRRQDALHQQGRSAELLGDWPAAGQLFRRAAVAAPAGELAPLGLFSALRLDWRAGREPEALRIYDQLRRDRRYRLTAGRAALFLAASDLVRGRTDRAGAWLDAGRAAGVAEHELAYWRGRRSELQRDAGAAARAYLGVLLADPSHPLAVDASGRLAAPALAAAARSLGLELSAAASVPSQFGAWLLLGESVEGQRARRDLLHLLAADRRTAPYVRLSPASPAAWPIFAMVSQTPEAQMISLGLASEGSGAMLRYFPPDQPALLLAGARLLLAAGEPRRAIYAAEVLRQRVPGRVPGRALAEEFRRSLYPLPHAQVIHREAARQGIDPHLLAAILREESRFDAAAVSPASARGLAQFTLPTARRIAAELGRAPLSPRQLADPEVSVALAARYLANLARDFAASPPRMVAAYNAGEPQARLWRSYCFSDDPAEYFTKVSFKETRAYVARVLSSREEYAELARR